MTAKEYLQQAYRIDRKIKLDTEKLAAARSALYGKTVRYDSDGSKPVPCGNGTESAVLRVMDLEERLTKEIDELTENQAAPAPGHAAEEKSGPAPSPKGESKAGICLCVTGAACLLLFGLLTVIHPTSVDQLNQSSVITLNGTGILIALFVLMMLLGMMMIFFKK